jgi:hypothetical protein
MPTITITITAAKTKRRLFIKTPHIFFMVVFSRNFQIATVCCRFRCLFLCGGSADKIAGMIIPMGMAGAK